MFVLTKSYISSTREFIVFICSINQEIAPIIGSADAAVGRGAWLYDSCGGIYVDCLAFAL